jgi:hypothetical protein
VEAGLQDYKIIVSVGAVSSNVKWKLLAGRKVRKRCLSKGGDSLPAVCVCVRACVRACPRVCVCVCARACV